MAQAAKIALKCLALAPSESEFVRLLPTIEAAAKEAGISISWSGANANPLIVSEQILAEIASADLIVALISLLPSTNVFFEIGMAQAMGKPIIFLLEHGKEIPIKGNLLLRYSPSAEGLLQLHVRLRRMLQDFVHNPEKFRRAYVPGARQIALPLIDLEMLEARQFENLCFELLTQMGFRRLEWGKELREFDAIATLPKEDPDGFSYNELWLISMGFRAPTEVLLDPDYLAHRILRPEFMQRFPFSVTRDAVVTILFMLQYSEERSAMLHQDLKRAETRLSKGRNAFALRYRIWDSEHISGLIQQYPQLAYKYFSEEFRQESKSRKTTEELYRETVALNESLQAANTALKEEREKRVRAERDAVWKDVAFKAAHKLGNPVFALETDLQGLKRRISNNPEASEVALEMGTSLEKAKEIIGQFKSLIRAQEISKREVNLQPLIQSASRIARENGVEVSIQINGDPVVMADPRRMTECFDELFANALHWFDKPQKCIFIMIDDASPKNLPPELDRTKRYLRIRFEDNGCGVPMEMKKQIFAPFRTTDPHGTGLGLSMVEKIIQGHGGAIHEIGTPQEGAVFEIFLQKTTENE